MTHKSIGIYEHFKPKLAIILKIFLAMLIKDYFQNGKFLLIITALVLLGISCASDKVIVNNGNGSEIGVLVDGQGSVQVNDRKRLISAGNSSTNVGQLDASTVSNDVIAIGQNRPMVINASESWTSGNDTRTVSFANEIRIPITVWIVKGNFNTQRMKAINACIYSSQRLGEERTGIDIGQFEIVNRTGMTNVSDFYHFPSTSNPQDWKDDVGYRNNRINIYYIETVSGSATTGRAVGFSEFIVLGQNFGDIAVVHEIGHSCSLRHKSSPDFNDECIMWPTYNTGDPWKWLSEGEVFRMHINSTSAINSQYTARSGAVMRSCIGSISSNSCVQWNKRIWADGTLPAN